MHKRKQLIIKEKLGVEPKNLQPVFRPIEHYTVQ